MIARQTTSEQRPRPRRTEVLRLIGVAASSWYRPPRDPAERKRPGPRPRAMAEVVVQAVIQMATDNPWYGYKRIAVMCRRSGQAVTNREAYVVMSQASATAASTRGRAVPDGPLVRAAAAPAQ
jgi:hypothetical protein